MRRKRHEEHLNHEAWAIPYADLMTLLLAFFVVMYAVSVVNEGKFRVMSTSMMEAFNGNDRAIVPPPKQGMAPPLQLPATYSVPTLPISVPLAHPRLPVLPAVGQAGQSAPLERIEDRVRRVLQPLIDRKLVILRRMPDRLEIEIRTDILFSSGVARLSTPANQVLLDLAATLAPFPNPLRVEGFTDNVPIDTPQYPSNWELSAARAASVARLFAGHGVRPDRLGIVGWGEVRPVADNATAEGRNHNRRVLVVVMNDRGAPDASRGDSGRIGEPGRTQAAPADATAASLPATRPAPASSASGSAAAGVVESDAGLVAGPAAGTPGHDP
ncbi:MAG: flagellar motor protein MotD [Xanthomonadaceae bacterium]|jgi:chemotaxis protein MotB|nr:flagellar motor protein MotD [Xanthomonadaceae bacterium]